MINLISVCRTHCVLLPIIFRKNPNPLYLMEGSVFSGILFLNPHPQIILTKSLPVPTSYMYICVIYRFWLSIFSFLSKLSQKQWKIIFLWPTYQVNYLSWEDGLLSESFLKTLHPPPLWNSKLFWLNPNLTLAQCFCHVKNSGNWFFWPTYQVNYLPWEDGLLPESAWCSIPFNESSAQ